MKRLLYTLLGASLLLTSCFKDEGNYDYQELNPPHWMQDYVSTPLTLVGSKDGGKINFKGSSMFVWDSEPEERAKQFRYEWVFNNKVVSEDLDFEMTAEELMQRSGITEYNASKSYVGTFNVVDRNTGVSFMARLQLWLYPFYAPYDWFILADDGGKTNLASVRVRGVQEDGVVKNQYTVMDYAYEHHNGGASIPGKPVFMSWSLSPHVASQGSITVLTDQVSYELKGDDLAFYGDLKDQFLDGTPANFRPVSRADIDRSSEDVPPCTFLVNQDGKVYTRIMSANYLGGKFLSEPYEIDGKGYEIDFFGRGRFGGSLPAYDRKNRRFITANVWRQEINHGGMGNSTYVFRTNMTPAKEDNSLATLPLYGFPEGTEVVNVTITNHNTMVSGTNVLHTIFYVKPGEEVTNVADFQVDNRSMRVSTSYIMDFKKMQIPKKLTKENQILVSCNSRRGGTFDNAKYRTYISFGNKLMYIDRDRSFMNSRFTSDYFPNTNYTFPSKITCLTYDFYYYDKLLVGCENGEFFIFDVTQLRNPILEYQGKVKGKILSFKQLGVRTGNHDNY